MISHLSIILPTVIAHEDDLHFGEGERKKAPSVGGVNLNLKLVQAVWYVLYYIICMYVNFSRDSLGEHSIMYFILLLILMFEAKWNHHVNDFASVLFSRIMRYIYVVK